MPDALATAIEQLAKDTDFSGVIRIDQGDDVVYQQAFGDANRAYGIANTVETQYAVASGSKSFTALAVMSLVAEGTLTLATTARSLLGADLPMIADEVTVEQLLAHRSGIGDYLDEEELGDISDYVMTAPLHQLFTTEGFVPMLDGFPMVSVPGEKFAYNNGAFVVLALLAERASGVGYHDLVQTRVLDPAEMHDTAFLRTDQLPARAARGYLEAGDSLQTNILHMPVRGNGDGGAFTTVADVRQLWRALLAGRIVPEEQVAEMVRPRSDAPEDNARYGLGFWLHPTTNAVQLTGYDAGASFRSVHDPDAGITHTVIANTSEGAWPIVRRLRDELTPH